MVCFLLTTQVVLLGYSATKHSPTHLEPAFLSAGISHWLLGRYDLYRVNPPLPRLLATLPILAVGCQTDWSRYDIKGSARPEFAVGEDFLDANGQRAVHLVVLARWCSIPFSLIGAYICYRWSHELFGFNSGIITLALYVFEPNLLAHGELVTPDSACTAFGVLACYAYWRWLKNRTWTTALITGVALGAAETAKMTWLFLYALWPFLWFVSVASSYFSQHSTPKLPNSVATGSFANAALSDQTPRSPLKQQFSQLILIFVTSIYFINAIYVFDGFGVRLGELDFVSSTLSGTNEPRTTGNRFRETILRDIRVPLPKQYLLGLDAQRKDFERYAIPSYLCGRWDNRGWWYYYLYGLLVKLPCGVLALSALLCLGYLLRIISPPLALDALALLGAPVCLLIIASVHTSFSIHLRYVLPLIPFLLTLLGQIALLARRTYFWLCCVSAMIGYSLLSVMMCYPHHLAYFNDLAGGRGNGYKHLLGSSYDWGQDLLAIKEWASQHPDAAPFYLLSQTRYNSFTLLSDFRFPTELERLPREMPENGTVFMSKAVFAGESWPFAHTLGYSYIRASDILLALKASEYTFTDVGSVSVAVQIPHKERANGEK